MNENYIEEMENEGEALNQSLALNKVIINLLKQQRETNKRMFIALIVSILVNLAIVGGFLWYESQWEYTETKEITQEQENVKVQALKSVPLVDGFWAKNNGRWH